jgi:hypothetical protein
MPKKSATARSGGQRNKPRVQKSIQLVRQNVEEKEPLIEKEADTSAEEEAQTSDEITPISASTIAALEDSSKSTDKESVKIANSTTARRKASAQLATPGTQSEEASVVAAPKHSPDGLKDENVFDTKQGTAASRLAARRQAAQKTQQRAAATLITAEHYAYVRRDLVVIAILAFIMFAVIIALHFVPAIGG